MRRKPGRHEREKIFRTLSSLYPDTKTQLNYSTPFELLIATMLSAQTTDRQVNAITRHLFDKFKSPTDYAVLSQEELEQYIKSCGLYKNKAKSIIATSKILLENYNSKIPTDFDELIKLPGVGRKTANVVLANAFNQDRIAVDTHVFRVSNRLGLADSPTPEKTEADLMKTIPAGIRNRAHHWLIYHGRNLCRAQSPKCAECPLTDWCRYYRRSQ